MALSSPGIGSNLPIDSIIEQLMTAESRPLNVLKTKESSYQSKLSAYGALSGALSSFQSTVSGLSSLTKFQQLSTTTSEAAVASASSSASAAPGKYDIEVVHRAQSQSISSIGQTSATASIGTGAATTISFQFGTVAGGTLTNGLYSGAGFSQDANQSTGTLTIDSSNNSLQGIRDAINKAGIGVTATIVADGSAAPNKLVLTSTKTGEASSMKISVSGDAALQDLLAYDPAGAQNLKQNTAAQDALLKVNGLDIKNATNTLSSTIEGLTVTLGKPGTTTITVARDTASIETGINAFIKSYNELHGTLKFQTGYNAATNTGGPLVGDATARTIQSSMRSMFSTQLEGLNGGLVNLSQIGVSFQKDGTLALDSSKLKAAIASNPMDIGKLFATAGTSSDSLVSFSASTAATKPGSNALVVTALATKGSITGSAAAVTDIVAGVNDELKLTIDGIASTITLAAGTYTADSLSAHLQSMVNGVSAFSAAGVSVNVSQAGGVLSMTSNRYGSASRLEVSGNGASDLMGSSPVATNGTDVAGTFNGVAALGNGQFLTGATGSGADGLKIQISGGALGARGSVNFSQGYATKLTSLLGTFIGSGGLISGRTDGINRSIKDIGSQRTALNSRLADTEARYRKQFTALDSMIARMSTTGTFLTQQLNSIANLSK